MNDTTPVLAITDAIDTWSMEYMLELLSNAGAVCEKDEVVNGLWYRCLLLNGKRYLFVRRAKEKDAKS